MPSLECFGEPDGEEAVIDLVGALQICDELLVCQGFCRGLDGAGGGRW